MVQCRAQQRHADTGRPATTVNISLAAAASNLGRKLRRHAALPNLNDYRTEPAIDAGRNHTALDHNSTRRPGRDQGAMAQFNVGTASNAVLFFQWQLPERT
jgi:hypothetical protein